MKPYNSNMFESIKNALDKAKTKTGGNSTYRNILQLEPGDKPYTVRLLPNIKNPEETILHYYHHGWNSIDTGQYASITSPSTWGDRCPVSELYFKVLRDGTDSEKERAKANLRRKENWLVNVYVVNDPKKPENNGTIKVLRYGKQLDKIIQSAINGDDSEEFGAKIFDLSEEGCNLRIKVELVSDKPGAPKYPTYTSSKFLNTSSIEGLDENKIQETYNNIYDLNTFVERKSSEDIKSFIDQHYLGKTDIAPVAAPVVEEEDVPYEAPAVKQSPAAKAIAKVESIDSNDSKVMDILNGLDNL
jgi:gp32 DNA binding protein like